MRMISERGINLDVYPVLNNLSNPTIVSKNSHEIFQSKENHNWSNRCYILMDFLATKAQKMFMNISYTHFNKYVNWKDSEITSLCPLLYNPEFILDMKDCNQISNHSLFEVYYTEIDFSLQELKELNIFPKSIKNTELIEIIKTASKFLFRTCFHFVSVNNSKLSYSTSNYITKNFENIFNFEVNNKNITIKFDTLTGLLFIHNIRSGGYSFVPNSIYSLSSYAGILYRKFFLHYSPKRIKLNLNYIATSIGLVCKDKWHRKNIVSKYFNELEKCRLISINEITNECAIVTKRQVVKTQ